MSGGNALYNVFEKEPCPPMSFAELRERLKYIAELCIGLAIDLANEIEIREKLNEENERLRRELNLEKTKPKRKEYTPEQREKQRQRMREYYERKRQEKGVGADKIRADCGAEGYEARLVSPRPRRGGSEATD